MQWASISQAGKCKATLVAVEVNAREEGRAAFEGWLYDAGAQVEVDGGSSAATAAGGRLIAQNSEQYPGMRPDGTASPAS